jgi:hypothetical protein
LDTAKLNDWLQVIGLFGVVASMVFVGLQMKLDREIARSEAFQARAESTADTLLSMSQNEAYVSVQAAIDSGNPETVTEKELVAYAVAMTGGMYLWENSYYQYRDGFLPEDHWTRTRRQMKSILAESISRSVATSSLAYMRPEFREELQRVITEVSVDANR